MNLPDKAVDAARNVRVSALDVTEYAETHGVDYTEAIWLLKLEAAAPIIAAQALRDYARSLPDEGLVDAWTILDGADEIECGQ